MLTAPLGVAASIERQLAREILRGDRVPQTTLPPVRTLADQFGVTPPTIQRVIDRLETSGLVTARRGSGVVVNDPRRSSDLGLFAAWFDAFKDQPAQAASILEDFLELRRVLTAHLVVTAGARLAQTVPQLAERVAAALAATTVEAIAEADAELTAALVGASDKFAVAAILQMTARLVSDVPHLADALFADRAYYRRVLRGVTRALLGDEPATVAADVVRVLHAWDKRTVAKYRAHLDGAS